MTKLLIVFSVLLGGLIIGLMGMGLFMLLPKKYRDKVEKFHEQ